MRKKNVLWSLAMCGMFTLVACSDDEKSGNGTETGDIPAAVLEAFQEKYPNATNVAWTTTGEYAVAAFYNQATRSGSDDRNNTAWFALDDNGWDMTESEIPFNEIPGQVKAAFESSVYAQSPWTVDDEVDMLLRDGTEKLYVIEVDKNEGGMETDVDLYYTEDGILVKEIIDADDDQDYQEYLPHNPATTISEWLMQNFPGARIIDVDDEDGGTEVEIIADGWKHEIFFGHSQNWIYTKTDYEDRGLDKVDAVVLNALRSSSYYTNDRNIDDIERYVTAVAGTYYRFELETRFDDDVDVYVSADGKLLDRRPSIDDDDDHIQVGGDIEAFINDKYPGAVILEKDYDDGYLEIEIRHEGYEKEIDFNGRNVWIRTTWELDDIKELPEAVRNALAKENYSVEDDDIDVIETSDGLYYKVEAEQGNREFEVTVSVDGTIQGVQSDDDDNDNDDDDDDNDDDDNDDDDNDDDDDDDDNDD